jgi:hypothetical protein
MNDDITTWLRRAHPQTDEGARRHAAAAEIERMWRWLSAIADFEPATPLEEGDRAALVLIEMANAALNGAIPGSMLRYPLEPEDFDAFLARISKTREPDDTLIDLVRRVPRWPT